MPDMKIYRGLFALLAMAALVALGEPAAAIHSQTFESDVRAYLAEQGPEADQAYFELNRALQQYLAQTGHTYLESDHRDREAGTEPLSALRERLLEIVPGLPEKVRDLGWHYIEENDRAAALVAGQWARTLDDGRESKLLRMMALAMETEEIRTAKRDLDEAVQLIMQLLEDQNISRDEMPLLCQVAFAAGHHRLLTKCSERLHAMEPEWYISDYFRWLSLISRDQHGEALAALDEARHHGMPLEDYEQLVEITLKDRPLVVRYGRPVLIGVAIWVGSFLLLLILGLVLSHLTLRAARRIPAVQSGEALGLDATLRKAYRAVIWLSCAFYYASLPFIMLVVLTVGAGLVYAMLNLGRIPIKALATVIVLVLVSIWAMLKGLLVRGRDDDPGACLNLTEHPRFRSLLDSVAAKIGTRPVDNVYLTPGTDLAVMERGGVSRHLRNAAERCLILGVGVLDGMRQRAFRAVLAHEYGHFSNRDTAGGGLALAVRRSLFTSAISLAENGAAGWYSPAWHFLRFFNLVFLRISQGASRWQEVLADRWAATAYGARAFEEGLRHVISRSVHFKFHINTVLKEVVEGKKPLVNLYQYRVESPPDEEKTKAAVQSALEAKASAYDSHPPPQDRIAWIQGLGNQGDGESADGSELVWELFASRAVLEEQGTEMIREDIRENHGIEIAAGAPTA